MCPWKSFEQALQDISAQCWRGPVGSQPGNNTRLPLHSGRVCGPAQCPVPASLGTEDLARRAGSSDFARKPVVGSLDKSEEVYLCVPALWMNPLRLGTRAFADTRNPWQNHCPVLLCIFPVTQPIFSSSKAKLEKKPRDPFQISVLAHIFFTIIFKVSYSPLPSCWKQSKRTPIPCPQAWIKE